MNTRLKKSLLVVAISSLFAASAAQATNGFFSEGTGAKNRALGGAGTALAQETGSIEMNPAAAVNMDPRMDIGAGIFSPSDRGYVITGNDCSGLGCGGGTLDGTQESRKTGFLIPFYGQNFKIDNTSSWAIVVSALGGMNSDYKNNAFAPFGATGALGINLAQVKIGGTYAKKIDDKLSVGVTLALVMQQFEAKGLGIFGAFGLSQRPLLLSDNGKSNSNGIGLTLGTTYKVNKDVTVGFVYSPSVDMSEFDEYTGLFAEAGDLDIPSHYSLGVAWQVMPKVLVSADYRKINYTDVASISNSSGRLTDGSCFTGAEDACLGGASGAGFGWNDMDIFKVGVQWEQSSDMTLRAGFNHGGSPIESEDATINVIAPGVVETHLAFGGTMKLDASSEITFDYVRSLGNSVSGAVPGVPGAGPPTGVFGGGNVKIEMEQNFIELQYGKKF